MSASDETAVLSAVFSFLDARRPAPKARTKARTIIVAFSGGPDSTALLWALMRADELLEGDAPRLVAAHLDHRLDPGSAERAARAAQLARLLGLSAGDVRSGRLPAAGDGASHGVEDWARRRRYEFLRQIAAEEDAGVVVTAHHADDQAETVALRLLYGSGVRGLAGVRPMRDLGDGVRLVRPLLAVRRREIAATLDLARRQLPGLAPIDDPTNADLGQPRALARSRLLPRLEATSPGAVEAMIRVAGAARGFRRRLDGRLDRLLAIREAAESPWSFLLPPRRDISLDAFLALPDELRRHALARLHARLGEVLPPSRPAMSELERQLGVMTDTDGEVGVDCGDGLRWTVRRRSGDCRRSAVLALQRRMPPRPFTYTFGAPGAAPVPEIFVSLHFRPWGSDGGSDEIEPWMLRGEVFRTGLSLPRGSRPVATVRSRRPGDRLRPLGASGSRKLKNLLIDRKVPRSVRDRLPLLLLDGILAWVPGVTVDERFRLEPGGSRPSRGDRRVWIAEIRPLPGDEGTTEG